MPSQFSIPQIVQFGQISQYLAANDKSSFDQFKSGSLIGNLPGLLYMEGTLLQNIHNLNPGSVTERPTAEYVLSLCGKYAIQAQNILNGIAGGLPVLTGPSNQSVGVGATATFSVSVAGVGPFTYAWFLNGIIIPDATSASYANVNSQLSDSGKQFSVAVTNAAGTILSGSATLTVTASLSGSFYYSASDPSAALLANTDPFSYQNTFSITHNTPFVITVPGASTPNMYIVIRVPVGESIKTAWNNQGVNSGPIPDIVWSAPIQFGGFTYYYTHATISLDPLQTLTLS